MSRALAAAGWTVAPPLGRGDDVGAAAAGADLLLIATPDAVVAEVAAAVEPVPTTVVAHCAGSLGLDVLAPHARRASIHPLVSIPTPDTDVRGAWFGIAGDDLVAKLVADLGGTGIGVDDEDRAAYHAAACIASNHLVALLGQVERVAGTAGVPLQAYLQLARQTLDNVELVGPRAALTGPVKRGDADTIERHRAALAPDELTAYDALVERARALT
jgi:predicted short-subunit dehydrogenase-like oxidoreductase (DUF2520 family)